MRLDLAAELLAFFETFPTAGGDVTDAERRLLIYADALDGLEIHDVREAMRELRRGLHDIGKWAPEPHILAQIVRKCRDRRLEALRWDRERAKDAAERREREARQPSPDERERVVAGFDSLLAELRAGGSDAPSGQRPPTRAEALASLETLRDRMAGPVAISPSLAAVLARPAPWEDVT